MLTLNDKRTELWQWDTGREVKVDGECSQVHFSNKIQGRSIDVDVVDGVAKIPDVLLQTDGTLNAWAFVGTSENGYTKVSKSFVVNKRNRPADYVFTPTDQTSIKELNDRLEKLEANQDPEAVGNAVKEYLENNPIKEEDPTVPQWAKQPEKPAYTAEEVGALPNTTKIPSKTSELTNDSGFLTQHQDLSAYAKKTDIPSVPTKTSQLTNDSGFLTSVPTEYVTEAELTAKGYAKQTDVTNLSKEIDDLKENGVGSSVEPMEDDIPKVYFTGTLPTSKTDGDLPVTIHYKSKTEEFDYYATLKVQGGSSASYPKKNFTLKMYEDEALENKVKYAFKEWGKLNKFVLKAHWIDHSHVRNVGTAKIWGKIVQSRSDYDSLPTELKNAPNNGATDGFTVKVFVNGVYQGLYEWIVPKDKLFGQDSDIATHSIMNSEWNNQPTCAFATTSPVISGNWSEELQDTMSSNISTSFANLIKFVAGSTDEEFVANAENYFDVQSVIDFDIFARVFCIVDNLCRNQIFFTYDGIKWYEGVWDVDAILGLPPTTRGFFAYNTEFQTGYIAHKDYGVTNMLYQRVENLFMNKFKERYAELRSTVLSIENIIEVYERLTDVITTYEGLLKEDYARTTGDGKFTGIPYTSENNIQQIRNFVAQRLVYMDEVIAGMIEPILCTGVTLNTNTLTFTAEGSQELVATVTPNGCTDVITWESNNTSVATVINGVVTAIANGSAIITVTCGNYSATCSVSVSGIAEAIPCTGISLSSNTLTFTDMNNQTLTATVTPENTTDVITWESSSPSVATVKNGVVTPVGYGDCTITATCGGYSATCSVSVEEETEEPKLLYSLPSEVSFDGTQESVVDTGVNLLDGSVDSFTIYADFTNGSDSENDGETLFMAGIDIAPYPVVSAYTNASLSYSRVAIMGQNVDLPADWFHLKAINSPVRKQIALKFTYNPSDNTLNLTGVCNGSSQTITGSKARTITEGTLVLGATRNSATTFFRFFSGTIHDFKVWNYELSESEIADLFNS